MKGNRLLACAGSRYRGNADKSLFTTSRTWVRASFLHLARRRFLLIRVTDLRESGWSRRKNPNWDLRRSCSCTRRLSVFLSLSISCDEGKNGYWGPRTEAKKRSSAGAAESTIRHADRYGRWTRRTSMSESSLRSNDHDESMFYELRSLRYQFSFCQSGKKKKKKKGIKKINPYFFIFPSFNLFFPSFLSLSSSFGSPLPNSSLAFINAVSLPFRLDWTEFPSTLDDDDDVRRCMYVRKLRVRWLAGSFIISFKAPSSRKKNWLFRFFFFFFLFYPELKKKKGLKEKAASGFLRLLRTHICILIACNFKEPVKTMEEKCCFLLPQARPTKVRTFGTRAEKIAFSLSLTVRCLLNAKFPFYCWKWSEQPTVSRVMSATSSAEQYAIWLMKV